MTRIVGPFAALLVATGAMVAISSSASAATIIVSPTTVAPGGNVDLSGDVLGPDGTPAAPYRAR